jgi:hypothetical protein
MTNSEEKDQQAQQNTTETSKHQSNESAQESNWAENQQVDEEGAEISPDDVK